MVFQGYALYPQMTAREILEFPLKMRGVPRRRARAGGRRGGGAAAHRDAPRPAPGELSAASGSASRWGAPSCASRASFSSTSRCRTSTRRCAATSASRSGSSCGASGATALYVTHDHVEAMTLADRIAVMRAGKLAAGRRRRARSTSGPRRRSSAAFLGSPRMNLLAGARRRRRDRRRPLPRCPRRAGKLPARLEVGVRPEHVTLAASRGRRPGEVVAVEPLGAGDARASCGSGDARAAGRSRAASTRTGAGTRSRVAIDAERAMVFDAEGDGARVG